MWLRQNKIIWLTPPTDVIERCATIAAEQGCPTHEAKKMKKEVMLLWPREKVVQRCLIHTLGGQEKMARLHDRGTISFEPHTVTHLDWHLLYIPIARKFHQESGNSANNFHFLAYLIKLLAGHLSSIRF